MRPPPRLLGDALSVLRVQLGGRGLERRSEAFAEAAFSEAVKAAEGLPAAGSATGHLRAAWDCVYAVAAGSLSMTLGGAPRKRLAGVEHLDLLCGVTADDATVSQQAPSATAMGWARA